MGSAIDMTAWWLKRALLALLLCWQAADGALRKAHHRTATTGFGDLVECKVAYDRLEEQCSRGGPPEAPSSAGGPKWGLANDADGGVIVNTAAPNEPESYKRIPYRPPESIDGKPNEISGWDYKWHGEDWGKLGNCGGKDQSPVDLPRYVDVQGQTKGLLWFDYYIDPDLKPSKVAHLVNDGHGLRYNVKNNGVDMGYVKIQNQEYYVSEYVFHAPSEHSLDGAVFPVELQVYHWPRGQKAIPLDETKGEANGVATAVFFREGPSNPFLAALMESMKGTAPTWSPLNGSNYGEIFGRYISAFDLEAVLPPGDAAKERSFYNYNGTSTQPPCVPGVSWWVLSAPLTATREEIRFIRRAVYTSPSMRHGNARSTMPMGNRSVKVALTGFQSSMKPGAVPIWAHLDEAKEPRGYNSQDIPWGNHWRTRAPTKPPKPSAQPAEEAEDASEEAAAEAAADTTAEVEPAPAAKTEALREAAATADDADVEAEAQAAAAQAEEEAAKELAPDDGQ